ncbi:hypothetical protein D0838_05120 [Bordetella avium]|uniref:hypothetical protein n=1 Tax=Bordetella avium TaxID=521 RepID=UPI000E6A5330|nr:hypothetical protein [Bordetella avium]RIQ74581.1 hypothetical protein D0838_05120 [Bordetella avium]
MEIKTYCEPGKSMQQRGGECPAGWVEMAGERPGENYIATESGEWVEVRYVPQSVTAAQGGMALIEAGLMDAVMVVVNSPELPAAHKWAWDRATVWERGSPSLGFIAHAAGISDEQMDDLFIRGDQIRP